MLRQRILTAVVLLAVVASALAVPSPWPFVALLTVTCTLAAWEWLRLTARGACAVGGALALAGALTAAAFALLHTPLDPALAGGVSASAAAAERVSHWSAAAFALLTTVSLVWLAVVPAVVVRARVTVPARSATLSGFAVLALAAAWLALVILFLAHGAWYVVSLLALVWCADIAAYFAGRRWGRRKLAPLVSPGKSLEGAAAGLAAAVVWLLATGQTADSFGHALLSHSGPGLTVLIGALLAAASIVGDLFESLVKRRAGVKDSSALLPGHGGVWDRIDAIVPVAPLALLLGGV